MNTLLQRNSKDAFTLVEVVISITILLVSVSASIMVLSVAMKRSATAENKADSLAQARAQIEFLRRQGFSTSKLSTGNHSGSGGLTPFDYNVQRHNSDNSLKRITVDVTWTDHVRNREADMDITTVFSDALH